MRFMRLVTRTIYEAGHVVTRNIYEAGHVVMRRG